MLNNLRVVLLYYLIYFVQYIIGAIRHDAPTTMLDMCVLRFESLTLLM